MAKKTTLTKKQEDFCKAVVEGKTLAEAWMVSHPGNFTYGSACRLASREKEKPLIKERIRELRNLSAYSSIDIRDILTDNLLRALEKANGDMLLEEYTKTTDIMTDKNGIETEVVKEKVIEKRKNTLQEVYKIADSLAKLYGLYEKEESTTNVNIEVVNNMED